MKPKWIVEKDFHSEGTPDRLVEVLQATGREFVKCKSIPFSNSIVKIGNNGGEVQLYNSNMPYKDDDCVIANGTIEFISRLMNPKRWTPTAWFNLENCRCTTYYAHYGAYCLQRDYTMLPWIELRRLKDVLFERHGSGKDWLFIKPDANLKRFSGKVVGRSDFEKWADMEQSCRELEPETLCVVARPYTIADEWRFVVCEHSILTGSQYKAENGLTVYDARIDPKAEALARTIAAEAWQPDEMYVLDICRTKDDGKYHLLELGPVNCAGLYACDMTKIVEKSEALALGQWKMAAARGE